MLRHPHQTPSAAKPAGGPMRTVWAKTPFVCSHGTCLAIQVRDSALWVQVRTPDAQEAWVQASRVLSPDDRRAWARKGFG